MPARGNWGDRMLIITPVLYKNVTCATCNHYCHEDCSCLVSTIIPCIDGYDYWKKCRSFDLSQEYCDEQHKKQVMAIKGHNFFKQREEKKDNLLTTIDRVANQLEDDNSFKVMGDIPTNFAEKFVYSMRKNHSTELAEISVSLIEIDKHVRCFVNSNAKLVAITLPQKNMICKTNHRISSEMFFAEVWTKFVNNLRNVLHVINNLPNSNDYEKWIVIPVIQYKVESCGETFYKTRGNELKGTKLVEMDEEGNLLFATGPIHEKYWTREKINSLEIFK